MVIGQTIELAEGINHEAVAKRVGPLPRHRQICYSLAALALANALMRLKEGNQFR